MRLLLLSLLTVPGLWANACATTGSGAFNWNTSAAWTSCGGTFPGNGDTAKITRGPVTVNVNTTVGQSWPMIPTGVVSITATGGGATGGSLAAGTYHAYVGYTSANGTAISVQEVTVTSASGNIPRITYPAAVTGATITIYLTAASGAANSETVYGTCNGSTPGGLVTACSSTTADLGSAQSAGAALPQYAAVNCSSAVTGFTIASGVTFTVRGDWSTVNGITLTMSDDSVLEIDASQAVTPASQHYRFGLGNQHNGVNSFIVTTGGSGTSAAHPATIRSNSGGGNAYYQFLRTDAGFGTALNELTQFTVSYITFLRIGDATTDAIDFINGQVPRAFDHTFTNVIFDTCGLINTEAPTAGNGFTFSHVTWVNTLNMPFQAQSGTAAPNAGHFRTFTYCIFDLAMTTFFDHLSFDHCLFYRTWTRSSGTSNWDLFSNNVVRLTNCSPFDSGCESPCTNCGSDITTNGSVTNNYFVVDSVGIQSPLVAAAVGAVSATSTTLTDAGATWTVNAYQSSSNSFGVLILSGTGSGQARSIVSNTATTLTLSKAWTVTPDSTSNFEIFRGMYNFHGVHLNGILGASPYYAFQNVCDLLGVDDNGDCFFEHEPTTTTTWWSSYNIVLPSMGLCGAGTVFNVLRNASNQGAITHIDHNTYYICSQSLSLGDQTTLANSVTTFQGNLAYNETPGSNQFKAEDIANIGGGGTIQYITSADYNACWNCNAGNYSGNGYDYYTGGTTAGCHDVTMAASPSAACGTGPTSTSGPQFQDSAYVTTGVPRNIVSWARTQGSTGNAQQVIADLWSKMLAKNNFTGAPTGYIINDLLAYIWWGYLPTNTALLKTAFDGTNFGAVQSPFGAGLITVSGKVTMSGK